jgi:hypothetical protein
MGIEAIPVTLSSTWHIGIPVLRAATFTLGALLRRLEADLLHIHNPKLAGLILRSPSRSVVTIHGGMVEFSLKYGRLGSLATKAMRSLLHRAGAVTSVMKSEADRNGWIWIPNMTDLAAIERIEPSKESYILFVGRNDPIKNYALFKRVMERIGKPYKALGVEEVASWERVISYMKAAECLVITSIWEGMPSVLLRSLGIPLPRNSPRHSGLQTLRRRSHPRQARCRVVSGGLQVLELKARGGNAAWVRDRLKAGLPRGNFSVRLDLQAPRHSVLRARTGSIRDARLAG